MPRNLPMHASTPQPRLRLCAISLALLYLVTATPLLPALTALLALSERSHLVTLQPTAHGIEVVLRHDGRHSPSHRHGLITRSLAVFAQRTIAPQTDHVIQFGATDTAQQTPVLAIEPTSSLRDLHANLVGDSAFPTASVTLELAAFPRPPPVPSGRLLTVRSNVLVI